MIGFVPERSTNGVDNTSVIFEDHVKAVVSVKVSPNQQVIATAGENVSDCRG